MLKLISFRLSGPFASFKDPSVTTNQTVYSIPSKSAIIGLLGAVLGVERGNDLKEIYKEGYLGLLKDTRVGIRLESNPQKYSFYTNHRSLKEAKMKPFKTELLLNPAYTIFVETGDSYRKGLLEALGSNAFKYSPCLGHSYCPAVISGAEEVSATETAGEGKETSETVLDEKMETNSKQGDLLLAPVVQNSKILIERHLHHFLSDGKLKRGVHRFWTPTPGSRFRIESDNAERRISKFVEPKESPGRIICLF